VSAHENEMQVELLLETSTLTIRDICCNGACRHLSPAECATVTHLVFPYRGAFARHVGKAETIAEANQLIFFNAFEEYAISHPADGGDASLSISIAPELLLELAPTEQLTVGEEVVFSTPARGIDPRAQALAALLRHGLARGAVETLEAETLALSLIRRALGDRTSHVRATTYGRAKLVDRTKLLLAANPGRRWTLAAIAAEAGVSPVYLTQVFAQAEGVPLYRYQLRLRLAQALDRLAGCEDVTMLALDLGFSSHSHFTAAFRQHFGQSPTEFQRAAKLR
jgi:AraC-like DNA-binding protein